MKTTVELPDVLIREAKRVAAEQGLTLRELIESGLRAILEERQRPSGFRLRDASVDGKGLQVEFRPGEWQQLRDATYDARGA